MFCGKLALAPRADPFRPRLTLEEMSDVEEEEERLATFQPSAIRATT